MRRSAAIFAAAFGMGLMMSEYVVKTAVPWLIMLTVMALLLVYSLMECEDGRHRERCIIMCFFAIGGLCLQVEKIQVDPLTLCEGDNCEISGIIKEVSQENDYCKYVVDSGLYNYMIRFYSKTNLPDDCKGKMATFKGKVSLPQSRRNPGCFDYRKYLRSRGIQVIVSAEYAVLHDEKPIPYLYYTGVIHNRFEKRILEYTEEENAGLIMAIMFGDKSLLDEDLYYQFQQNGTAHVLAVSGLHTGIIYAVFAFLWRGRRGLLFNVIACSVLFVYMTLADFSPSVVRASCMILMHCLATVLRCRYDLLSAAGVTFVFMLLINPYQFFDTGFQMSFLAIASLAVILPAVKKVYQGILLSSVTIQAGMVLYNAYVFNYVSAGAVLANIPVIFLTGIMLPVGLCALACSFIQGTTFGFLVTVLEICGELLYWINSIFYACGRTSFDVVSPPVWLMIIYYGIIFFFLSEMGQIMMRRRKYRKIAVYISVLALVAAISVPVMSEPLDEASVVFVDVGQGDCIHVKTPSGKNYLIDGGGSKDYDTGIKTVKPYLLKNGVRRIDAAFVTHLHEDHYGGIKSLAEDGMVDSVYVYEAYRQKKSELEKTLSTEIEFVHRGDDIQLDENISIEVLAPELKTELKYKEMLENEVDENELCLIFILNYEGTKILITGDIDEEGEEKLVRLCGDELDSDIIKVPHHGSKYSSSETFIKQVSPLVAVFQVGRNNYGHPSDEAIERYESENCLVVRNDKNGAVGIVRNDEGTAKVVYMIN